MVLINPKNLKVFIKVFDTGGRQGKSDGLIDFIKNFTIPEGFIVIFACKDECCMKLADEIRDWFRDKLGSLEIKELFEFQGFALITKMGQKEPPNERKAMMTNEWVQVLQIIQVDRNAGPI